MRWTLGWLAAAALILIFSCGGAQSEGKADSEGPSREGSMGSGRSAGSTGPREASYVKDEVLVKFKKGVSRAQVEEIARTNHLKLVKPVALPDLYLFKIPGGSTVQEAIDLLERQDEVQFAEPNYIGKIR